MTAATNPDHTGDPAVDALIDRLPVLAGELKQVEEDRDRLYAERLTIYRALDDAGLKQAVTARLAGVGSSAVGFALHHHGKKAGTKAPKAKAR